MFKVDLYNQDRDGQFVEATLPKILAAAKNRLPQYASNHVSANQAYLRLWLMPAMLCDSKLVALGLSLQIEGDGFLALDML